MALPNAKQLLAISGGAVKIGTPDAPLPTGVDFAFTSPSWSDLGALKTGPTLTPTDNVTTSTLWNMEDYTNAGGSTYALDFGAGEWNHEVLQLTLNYIKTATGSYIPAKTNWVGQVAALFYYPQGVLLLHAPNVVVTGRGAINFGVKNEVAEQPVTLSLNADDRLENGAPFQWFSTEELTPQSPLEV